MKRYLLFGMHRYYPSGGWSDYMENFDSIDDAKNYILDLESPRDFYQIVDIVSGRIIFENFNKKWQ